MLSPEEHRVRKEVEEKKAREENERREREEQEEREREEKEAIARAERAYLRKIVICQSVVRFACLVCVFVYVWEIDREGERENKKEKG